MKFLIKSGALLAGLLFSIVFSGCSRGQVPNSSPEEIESAKFDPAEAKKGVGTAIPPD
ncbi:MAG: hypothetical protein VX768_16225 [Planctomycetota bacterium]|nr:hypothetical protein [Planctomycetota bacterium]